MIAWESGTREAPKAPCSARNSTSCSSVWAAPHSIDTTVKPTTAITSTRRRPKRLAQKPAIGVMIAEHTI
jgi:hypothetical protein